MKNWYQMSQTQVMKKNRRDGADRCGRSKASGTMRFQYPERRQKKEPVTGIWRAVSGSSGDHIDHCSNYFRYFR